MKKILLSFIAVATFFAINGCTDINVSSVPSIENPDGFWSLEYDHSFFQNYTTNPLNEEFTYKIDRSKNQLTITHYIEIDQLSEVRPSAKIVNQGKDIEITYRDESGPGIISTGQKKDVEMIHYFDINSYGKGAGSEIKCRINYVFPNPNLGSNRIEAFTITE